MCGRFTLTNPIDELAGYFEVLATADLPPRFNIAPTQPVACVRGLRLTTGRQEAPSRELTSMRWGLIPRWAKDPAIGSRMINARAETVAEKPAFREAFRERRCLVVADGFYEWMRRDGAKQPYFIYLENRRPFAFAGIWESWRPGEGHMEKLTAPGKPEVPLVDGRVESCSFMTVDPNELMQEIHDRMPAILPREHWDTWLDPEVDDPEQLSSLLLPYPAAEMRAHPVSPHVNKPTNDDPTCTAPIKKLKIVRPSSPRQETLF